MGRWYLDGERFDYFPTDSIQKERPVIVLGSLERDRRLSRILEAVGRERVQCIFDFDGANWDSEFEGIPVLPPAPGADAVLVSPDYDLRTTLEQAQKLGYEKLCFYVPEEKAELIEQYCVAFAPFFQYNVIQADRAFKYIHLMPDEKFFTPLAEMIEYGLDPNEHLFFIYNMAASPVNAHYGSWEKYQEWMQRYQNIYLLQNRYPFYPSNWAENRSNFDAQLAGVDKIIFHGGWNIWGMEDYFVSKLDVIKEKGLCIPWSGSKTYRKDREQFIRSVVQYVRMVATSYSNIKPHLITHFEALRSAIWLNTKISYARLTKLPPRREKRTRNILAAHSANAYTNAVETLEYLTDIDGSFQIYSITSYGALVTTIEQFGTEKYGSRFTAVKKYMGYEEYVEFLSTMDAAILGMEAMAGRGTLELMFWLGVKVYLKPGTDVWNRMVNERGYRPADYYSVKDLTVDELLDDPDEEWNRSIAASEFDADEKVKQWRELFEYDWGEHT